MLSAVSILLCWAGFAAPVRHASSADWALVVHDLDGDGLPEIVASGNQTADLAPFSLFFNRGGTFAAERLLPSGVGEIIEDAGDLDGDGIPDLVASNYFANGIAVYRGRGALQFDAEIPYATATHGGPSRILDFDGDGVPDLVSLSFGSGNPVRVHLFRGPALSPKVTFDTNLGNGATPSARTINSALEILVSEHFGDLGLLRLTPAGVIVSRIDVRPGMDFSSTFADVNGDGVADAIAATDGGGIVIALANADGTFRANRTIAASRALAIPIGVQAGDFDGDGHADIIVAEAQTPRLHLFRGDGAGNFDDGIVIDAGGPINDLAAADVDGDGWLDVVTVNNDHSLSVLLNRGPCPAARRRAARH